MNQPFENGESRVLGEIDHRPPALMPTALDTAATFARQIRVVRDAPESHSSGKNATVDAPEHLFDRPRPTLTREISEWRCTTKRELGLAQPSVGFLFVAEDPFRKPSHAREPDRSIGFLDGQWFVALDAARKGAFRHHQGENLVLRIAVLFERAQCRR